MKLMRFRANNRNILVDFFCILLGINSLIATNGLWVELPVMVPSLPEGWTLPSYLTIIIQIANIGPILYSLSNYLWPNKVTETRGIYFMLVIGSLSSLFMIFFWSKSQWILNAARSLPLFIMTFFLALVDSISSVVCLPYMARFKAHYVTSYMIGESLGGFLPSMLALAQGVDDYTHCINESIFNITSNQTQFELKRVPPNQNFPPEIFFTFLFILMVISSAGFIMLNHLPLSKREKVQLHPKKTLKEQSPLTTIPDNDTESITISPKSHRKYILLFMQWWVSALGYAVLPSIQSFSCLPYGSDSYHYAVVLCSVATPVACVVAVLIPSKRISVLILVTIVGSLISIYIMFTAVLSPLPPLMETDAGSVVIVLSWIVFTFLFGYVKVIIASMCRDIGHGALFWCGALTQVGSALGAVIMFLLVSVFQLFHEKESC